MLQAMSMAVLWAAQQRDNGEVYYIPDRAKAKSNTVSRPLSLTATFAPATQISPLNETNYFLEKEQEACFSTKTFADTLPQQEQLGSQQGSRGIWG